jgi:hypothetical protein
LGWGVCQNDAAAGRRDCDESASNPLTVVTDACAAYSYPFIWTNETLSATRCEHRLQAGVMTDAPATKIILPTCHQ